MSSIQEHQSAAYTRQYVLEGDYSEGFSFTPHPSFSSGLDVSWHKEFSICRTYFHHYAVFFVKGKKMIGKIAAADDYPDSKVREQMMTFIIRHLVGEGRTLNSEVC